MAVMAILFASVRVRPLSPPAAQMFPSERTEPAARRKRGEFYGVTQRGSTPAVTEIVLLMGHIVI